MEKVRVDIDSAGGEALRSLQFPPLATGRRWGIRKRRGLELSIRSSDHLSERQGRGRNPETLLWLMRTLRAKSHPHLRPLRKMETSLDLFFNSIVSLGSCQALSRVGSM